MKIIFSHYTITIHQLSTLIHLLQHDQTKEDALKKSYYSLKDKKGL
ncbi:MAG: hypothetical protein KatS3mg027_1977 [Bacteroidia bacterium]|nr:MAG: hypothetical protein KatS3mg027_1977 [Bacteroidia bacterium]